MQMEINSVFIYTICDPRNGDIKYVGKTIDPKTRFRKHIGDLNKKTYLCQWIKGVLTKGLKPVFNIICECDSTNWERMERHYIAYYKSIGCHLLNITPGGEGGSAKRGYHISDEHKAAISRANKGRVRLDVDATNKAIKGREVFQYDLTGKFIATHPSIREAAKSIGRNFRRVQKMVNGNPKVKSVGGYKFQYANVA